MLPLSEEEVGARHSAAVQVASSWLMGRPVSMMAQVPLASQLSWLEPVTEDAKLLMFWQPPGSTKGEVQLPKESGG